MRFETPTPPEVQGPSEKTKPNVELKQDQTKQVAELNRVETELGKLKIIQLSGDVIGQSRADEIMTSEMQRLGVLDNPDDYLIRLVRATLLNKLLIYGCERDDKSYRDRLLETDFGLAPNEYTYAYSKGHDTVGRYVRNASNMIQGGGRTVVVFYKASDMVPHHEEKYDAASSLGMGATAVTYSFQYPDKKPDAIHAVVTYSGIYASDYYMYASELVNLGRQQEAISAFKKFIDAPPEDWSQEEIKKWIGRAKKHIADLEKDN
jgi:tetratricopeptide (TPR) repeat protein